MRSEQFVYTSLLAVVLAAALGACSHHETALERQGKDLFGGAVALKARMAGHDSNLPPSVVRCQNCHHVLEPRPVPSAAGPSTGPADKVGPVLNRQSLTEFRQRRGGPFSNYDENRFCRALRDGIDPAYVMLPSIMPRYAVTNQECQALWAYLVRP